MELHVSTYAKEAIYEQIEQQIREQIITGVLSKDEQLPSIRVLAAQLEVGIITVKRAYEDLEKEGFLYNRQGKGCFVKAIDRNAIQQMCEVDVRNKLQEVIHMCVTYAITKEELESYLNEEWRNHYECIQDESSND